MDGDLLQARLDYFFDKGYITYAAKGKKFSLYPATLLLILKVYSMSHGLSFPRVNAKAIKEAEVPIVYATDLGVQVFIKHLGAISIDLFELIAPIHKNGKVRPHSFAITNTKTYLNLIGDVGEKRIFTGTSIKKIHLLVDNTHPFDYLKAEYIYDSMYEARLFINKLVTYLPPSRLELWRVRTDSRNGQIRKDPEPVLISKAPYKK